MHRPIPALATAFATILLIAVIGTSASAHHNVEEMVRLLTERIESGEADEHDLAELHYRRATEYRALRLFDKAQSDLEKATGFAPEFVAAHQDLGRVLQLKGRHADAMESIGRAIEVASTDREKASAYAIRSEFLMAADKPREALEDCQRALETYRRGAVDWFLLRADLQAQLGISEERLAGLQAGHARTRSAVLYNAWVEALIDAGQFEKAAPIVEEKLAAARLKSTWLLRRAKLLTATGEDAAAKADLLAAIEELNGRINPNRPDVTLLVDRGIAWSMLDDRSAAKRDLIAAKRAGADRWVTARLEKALGLELQH